MSQLYLIYGDDEFLVSEKAAQVVETLVPVAARDTQLDVVDGAAANMEEALAAISAVRSALQSLGLFSSERTVWLRDATFLRDSRVGRTNAVKEGLEPLVAHIKAGLSEGTNLLVTADGVHKARAFYKIFKKEGEVHEFSVPSSLYQADKLARQHLDTILKKRDLRMDGSAIQLFFARVGSDTRQLVAEVEKLCIYLGDRKTAGVADIEAITSTSREAAGWDIADAYGERDIAKCLLLLEQLLFQKVAPISLIIAIETRIRELLIYRMGIALRWIRPQKNAAWATLPPVAEEIFAEHMVRDPRALHPYVVGLRAEQAANFTSAELKRALDAATHTHELMVSVSHDPKAILTRLLIDTLRPQAANA